MKTQRIQNLVVVTLLCAAVLAGLAACDTDPVEREGGRLPDKDGLMKTYGMLRSNRTSDNEVAMLLTQGAGFVTDNIYYQITKPAADGLSLDVRIDNRLLDAYNAANDKQYTLLPEANYEFPDGKTMTITQDAKRTELRRIKVIAEGLEPGQYLLPVSVADENVTDAAEKQVLYYVVTIRQPQLGDHELHNGDDIFFVFYIDTKTYQPLLVDDYFMEKRPRRGSGTVWYNTIGNIINLRTCVLDYETQTGRARLYLGSDMRYVLDHCTKYVSPLQDKGRKVCLCLEGGGKGLGFCNMTDEQIKDFVAQVKVVVAEYGLDGINLWDRNAGYGKEGMPAMNTTSYPKLIVALHDALKALGEDKILTLTDYMEPTEYFWDMEATGGIEVGKYLDYAWSGYRSGEELTQIVDPWHQGEPGVSTEYPRKPIAGMDKSKYGCVNSPWYKGSAQEITEIGHIADWVAEGMNPNNILVAEDLRTNLQDAYEGQMYLLGSVAGALAKDGPFTGSRGYNYDLDQSVLGRLPNGNNGYGKWLKDW